MPPNGLFAYWPIIEYSSERFGSGSNLGVTCTTNDYFKRGKHNQFIHVVAAGVIPAFATSMEMSSLIISEIMTIAPPMSLAIPTKRYHFQAPKIYLRPRPTLMHVRIRATSKAI